MFERYTEKARRVIFFARYEASQFGSPYIETEHLLLGLLREDKALTNRFLRSVTTAESIREQIEQNTVVREKVSTSVDLPLSNEGKRVLAYAAEEAERLAHKHIGTEHLLLGLLREEKSFAAAMLHERGVRLSSVREELAHDQGGVKTKERVEEDLLAPFSSDLTQQAAEGRLQKIVGRDAEMKRTVQVLGRANKRNPVLVGERGVGRRSIVTGLAQRIFNGEAPTVLAGKRIVELDLATMVCSRLTFSSDFAGNAIAELMSSADVIFFVPDLFSLVLAPPELTRLDPAGLLKIALAEDKMQCITSATPEESQRINEGYPWLARYFVEIPIAPPTEDEAFKMLEAAKARLEKHHSVAYSDDAMRHAVIYSNCFIKNRTLPDKALDLLDEAGSFVRARVAAPPEEIATLRKEIRVIVKRMEDAIANHEFQKARYYSDQERTEREKLNELEERHHVTAIAPVTREAIEEVLSGWTGIPVSKIRESGKA